MELLWWRMQAVRGVRLSRLPQAVRDVRAASAARHASQQDLGAGVGRAAVVLRENGRTRGRIGKAYRRVIGAGRHAIIIANA